ncbi:MAG: hypothetical protein WC247_02045 [Porticoccaceae bacterium]
MPDISPDIFIEDFERTENTDFLHGVLGRSLILATRFDAMCDSLALAMDLRYARVKPEMTDEKFVILVEAATTRYRSLNNNIDSLGMPDQVAAVLHRSRKARNAIAHSLATGLTGCLDLKIGTSQFLDDITRLIEDIVIGDVIVSMLVSVFNNERIPNKQFINSYKSKMLKWVVCE